MAAVELEGLTKHYGGVRANDSISFAVERGEIFGYLGPNGAGKTTTIRMLLGLISPTDGSARVLGADITDERALIEAKRRIGYLPDDPQFDESATGREILELHAGIKGDERSEKLLDLFDPPLERPIREYSHGNVRKLGLVTAFMHDPELVILDEPTGGLDPLMKQRFAEFVRGERDRGRTLFFSSHILGEVRRLCDRVGIIRSGRVVTVEPIDALVDRSGKVVRLVTADPIPRATFDRDLEGVHDLEVGAGNRTHDPGGGRTATTDAQSDPTSGPDDSGNKSIGAVGESDRPETFREYTFTFTGPVDELLAVLSGTELVDLTIEEAPLESVLLRFYGDGDDA
ncbi:ABC transporter ATP-binding protein [Natrarchaeobius halalkaliphilus]|uniref:ABC transporter ATP-binding protein n=1 Tax=Natrarchaeobius halalkaliphilus TaxID=1679091 RepID=A0A3N6LIA2_9EURY|nr:ABC transporter ATP-binding protein [Natrarchaeobius halalkaliphilus]RQG87054.1 ABC transporter ATP-binding protein [Natrarchaeobius halalkaliphilus]